MIVMRRVFHFSLIACGAILLNGLAPRAVAQGFDPCGAGAVFDAGQNVCWLADANLAGDASIRALMGVSGINPNGTMDFYTAQAWVAALNSYNHGKGYLDHNTWQLPVTPLQDTTCAATGTGGGNFGPQCAASAMGNLYSATLGLAYPNSVAPRFGAAISPLIQHLKMSYYWAMQNDNGNQEVFSFSNGAKGGVTTKFTYYYVLPMITGAISGAPGCRPGDGVLTYTSGPAANQSVYDCITGYTWLANGNLAAKQPFGIKGRVTIRGNNGPIRVRLIDGGRMLFDTATQWIEAMDDSQYLSSSHWRLPPTAADLNNFFTDLKLSQGDSRLMFKGSLQAFQHIQPFYYWGCQATQPGIIESPCLSYAPSAGEQNMQWTFNFDYGFQGTAETIQQFFVMVYFPAPPPGKCSNPVECCVQAGGTWVNGHCQG